MAITQQDLADFHRVSKSAVKQWSKQKQHEKKVQLIAGVDLEVSKLLGEIIQLVYLYNCKNICGVDQNKSVGLEMDWSWLKLTFDDGKEIVVDITGDNAQVNLETVRANLKNEIY